MGGWMDDSLLPLEVLQRTRFALRAMDASAERLLSHFSLILPAVTVVVVPGSGGWFLAVVVVVVVFVGPFYFSVSGDDWRSGTFGVLPFAFILYYFPLLPARLLLLRALRACLLCALACAFACAFACVLACAACLLALLSICFIVLSCFVCFCVRCFLLCEPGKRVDVFFFLPAPWLFSRYFIFREEELGGGKG